MNPILVTEGLLNGVLLGMLYSLVALGLSLIFGVMDIINFAHGDFVMIAGYFTYVIAVTLVIDPSMTVIITMPLFFVIGIVIYKVLIEPILGAEPLIQIAVTVGLMMVLENVALAIWRAEPKAYPNPIFNFPLQMGPVTIVASRVIAAGISVIILILIHLLLTRTKFGIAMRATSDDREVAALMGINVKKVYSITFGLGTALTALAAALIMTFGQVNPYLGTQYSLLSWVIVAMGGLGGIIGVFVSGLIVGIFEAIGITFFDPSAKHLFVYLLFLFILWFRPRGLFGKR